MKFLKDLFTPKDLTVGEPWKRIVRFAFPMLIGNLAQQFYNTADSIIVVQSLTNSLGESVIWATGIYFYLLVTFLDNWRFNDLCYL